MTSELKKILAEKIVLHFCIDLPFYTFLTWPYFHDHIFQHGSAHCWTQGSRQQLQRRVGKCGQRSRLGSQSWDLGRGPEATAWTQRSMEGCGWVMGSHRWTGYLLIGCVEHCGTIEVGGGQLWAVPCKSWRLWRKVAAEFWEPRRKLTMLRLLAMWTEGA